jgi:hypothetical protein
MRWNRPRIGPLSLALLLLIPAGCAAFPQADPAEPPALEVLPAEVEAPPPEKPPTLPELYARHLEQLVENDIALARIAVEVGESVAKADGGGQMMLQREAFSRIIGDVAALRASRESVMDFWDRVKDQWSAIATHEDRAALELLRNLDRAEEAPPVSGE